MYTYHEKIYHSLDPCTVCEEEYFEFYFSYRGERRIKGIFKKMYKKFLDLILLKIVENIKTVKPTEYVVFEAALILDPRPVAKYEARYKDCVVPFDECLLAELVERMFTRFRLYYSINVKGIKVPKAWDFGEYLHECMQDGAMVLSIYHYEKQLPSIETLQKIKSLDRGCMTSLINNGLTRMTVWYNQTQLKKKDRLLEPFKLGPPNYGVILEAVLLDTAHAPNLDEFSVLFTRLHLIDKLIEKLKVSVLLNDF